MNTWITTNLKKQLTHKVTVFGGHAHVKMLRNLKIHKKEIKMVEAHNNFVQKFGKNINEQIEY